MPLYDYHCTRCDARFEASHSMSDASPPCPHCGATPIKEFRASPSVHGSRARGRERAVQSLQPSESASGHKHGPGCGCGPH
jgi:putative FmdB family regulatory protein